MAQRKYLFTLFVIASVASVFYYYRPQRYQIPSELVSDAPQISQLSVESQQTPEKPIEQQAARNEKIKGPSKEQVSKEVAQNPHAPPESLVRFADQIAPRMRAAIESETEAKTFINDLGECVKNEQLTPVRALCLSDALELSRKHTSLVAEYNKIDQSAPEDVKKLVRVIDRR